MGVRVMAPSTYRAKARRAGTAQLLLEALVEQFGSDNVAFMEDDRLSIGICCEDGDFLTVTVDSGSRPSPHGQPPYPETTDVAAHDRERHHLLDPDDPVVLGCIWCQS